MKTQDFQRNYAELSDDELRQILADKDDLVPEALSALEEEVRKRKLRPAEPLVWQANPSTGAQVRSLEDYDDYRRIRDQQRLIRWAYFIAIAPFVFVFFISRWIGDSVVLVMGALVWCMAVALYFLVLCFRFFAYRCPQCSDRFGRGDECQTCGFPRSAKSAA